VSAEVSSFSEPFASASFVATTPAAQESKSGMTPAESAAWYRENAAMCVAIAQRTSDAAKKLLLLQMAQDWANLAEELLKLEECATRNAGSHRGKCH
jgi:hypothetical protein